MSKVWIVTDGKQGHYNQSLGLAMALKRLRPELKIETLPVLSKYACLKMLMGFAVSESFVQPSQDSKPDLVIAAGHATHLTLWVLGQHFKAKKLLLMKPSMPIDWFDLCFIPVHDQPKPSPNVVVTQGALNPMRPGTKQHKTGVMLIGGPSKHHEWDEFKVLSQIEEVLKKQSYQWVITSSRRTPESTMCKLQALKGVEFIPHTDTPQGWLTETLASTDIAWVTADSVSMIYEALTAGCRVGVLEVTPCKENRLTRGVQALAQEGTITLFSQWTQTHQLCSKGIFNEADRCADVILKRGWL